MKTNESDIYRPSPILGGESPEEMIFEAMQNKIGQEVFGTFTNNAPAPAQNLTLEKLKLVHKELNEYRTVYYRISNHVPAHNRKGEPVAYYFGSPDYEAWIHPDNLSDFKQRIDEAGLIAKDVKKLTGAEDVWRIIHNTKRRLHEKKQNFS